MRSMTLLFTFSKIKNFLLHFSKSTTRSQWTPFQGQCPLVTRSITLLFTFSQVNNMSSMTSPLTFHETRFSISRLSRACRFLDKRFVKCCFKKNAFNRNVKKYNTPVKPWKCGLLKLPINLWFWYCPIN